MPNLEEIRQYFARIVNAPTMVAFSGGADSVLVLKLALDAAGNRFPIYALYADAPWMPRKALMQAQQIASDFGIDLHVVSLGSPKSIGIENNPKNRCYLCKKAIFDSFQSFGRKHGCGILLEGTQLDDLTQYRPGLQAIAESGALSPLKELRLHKADVRELLQYFKLSAAKKPSGSCLATRIAYDHDLSEELFSRIDCAENWLQSFGVTRLRVRSHGEIARIEVNSEDFGKIIAIRAELTKKLKALGWKYVTLDLEGFRSGSMD